MRDLGHYELFATLFEYPERDFPAQIRQISAALGGRYDGATTSLQRFAGLLPSTDDQFSAEELEEAEELFTRSFDVQSATTLDVGYVMFGDDYKRGELLVNLLREHRAAGVDCGTELPDHLPVVLRLISRWQDRELATEFVEEILHPVLVKMVGEFSDERVKQRNALYKKHYKTLIESSARKAQIYRHALAALLCVLREDFGLSANDPPEKTSGFLKSIRQELDVEARGAGERPVVQRMRGG